MICVSAWHSFAKKCFTIHVNSRSSGNVVRTDRLTDRISVGVITRLVHRDLVDEVLNQTRHIERRSRLLPARVVVYYVLALTLFYEDAYEEVMRKLANGLRFVRGWKSEWHIPTTGAISQARARLGEEPLKELYARVAVPMARPGTRGAWYGGHRLMAIDGVVLDAPDTPENVAVFAKKPHRGGDSAFPQIRVLGLGECGTHAIVAASIGSWQRSERDLGAELLTNVEPNMLVIADRGFYSYEFWKQAANTGAALLWRLPSSVNLPGLEAFADGSYRSELLPKQLKTDLTRGMKRRVPPDARIPVRVIEYTIPNRDIDETYRLVTTLTNPADGPADELARLYEQRWEFELGLDEIETHQMPNNRLLRSRKPELVKQEIWGLLITHYAIRDLMREAADEIDLDPDRLSFIRSLRVVRRSVANGDDFPPSPGPSHGTRRNP